MTCSLTGREGEAAVPRQRLDPFDTVTYRRGIHVLCIKAMTWCPFSFVGVLHCVIHHWTDHFFYELSRHLIKSCIPSNRKLTANSTTSTFWRTETHRKKTGGYSLRVSQVCSPASAAPSAWCPCSQIHGGRKHGVNAAAPDALPLGASL